MLENYDNLPKEASITESIEFDKLRSAFPIYDQEIFELYVEEIFNDLAVKERTKEKDVAFIQKNRFVNFLSTVPIFISEKLYNALCVTKENYLLFNDFLKPLVAFKYGTFEDSAKVIFSIFDFDKDKKVNPKDIKLLLSYLPLKSDPKKKSYKLQMSSLKELDELIENFNTNKKEVNFEDFLNILEKKVDVFLHLFCYLYLDIPIFQQNLDLYKKKFVVDRKSSKESPTNSGKITATSNSSIPKQNSSGFGTPSKKFLLSPSCFSPITDLHGKSKKGSLRSIKSLPLDGTPTNQLNNYNSFNTDTYKDFSEVRKAGQIIDIKKKLKFTSNLKKEVGFHSDEIPVFREEQYDELAKQSKYSSKKPSPEKLKLDDTLNNLSLNNESPKEKKTSFHLSQMKVNTLR